MAVDYEYTPPSSPFRKALHTCMFLILGATWSVALVQFGERKGFAPAAILNARCRCDRFYHEHAPDKAGDVAAILKKNRGDEAKLFKRLSKKYEAAVPECDVASLLGAAGSLAVEFSADKAPPQAREAVAAAWGKWLLLSRPKQLVTLALQALLFVLTPTLTGSAGGGGGGGRRVASFAAILGVLVLCLLRPFPTVEDCAPGAVRGGAEAFWDSLESQEKLWIVTMAAVAAGLLRNKGGRRVVVLAWAAVVLVLTNPGAGGAGRAEALGAVAAKGTAAASLARSLPEKAVKVVDFGAASVLTVSTAGVHGWRTPAVAVGAAGGWVGLAEMAAAAGQGGVNLSGRPVPCWAVPGLLLMAAWGVAQLNF